VIFYAGGSRFTYQTRTGGRRAGNCKLPGEGLSLKWNHKMKCQISFFFERGEKGENVLADGGDGEKAKKGQFLFYA